jgi:hypothetical protein
MVLTTDERINHPILCKRSKFRRPASSARHSCQAVRAYAEQMGVLFMETSAKSGQNVATLQPGDGGSYWTLLQNLGSESPLSSNKAIDDVASFREF